MLQESAVKDTSEVYVKAAREAISMAEEKEGTIVADDVRLAELGYKSEFRREFSMIETIAFSFSIMAVIPGIASTLSISLPAGKVGMLALCGDGSFLVGSSCALQHPWRSWLRQCRRARACITSLQKWPHHNILRSQAGSLAGRTLQVK